MTPRALFILLAAAWLYPPSAAAEARKPNVILIMVDDFGYECVTANGGTSYQTPNLDRLAASGVRFERCNVQPLCTPTRLQLMTGQYNVRNYIAWATIDPNATTFGHLLKNAGYATAIAGKWQLGRVKDLPRRLGFDESCLWQHTRRPPRYANPGLEYNGEQRDFQNGEYGPDLVSDFALDFITRHKSEPFFLYYPMMLTHSPYQPTPDSPDWDPKAMGEKVNESPRHFAEMVAYMDKLVGRLVSKVDELGIRDNTLIIFLGDNGTGRTITSQFKGAAYDGGKGSPIARGMHVPLIANWPGHTPAGSANDDLIDSTDFLPTICEAVGAKIPAALTIDGRSFLPQILGKKGQPREWIYTWFSKDGVPPISEFITTKEYKLYRNGHFYDLKKDPYEDRPPQKFADLTGSAAAAAKKLKAVLADYADARPAELRQAAATHDDLSYYLNPKGANVPIRTPADWQHRRAHIVAGMEEVMGPLPHPAVPTPLDVQVVEEHQEDGYVRRKLAYHTDDPKKVVKAWLLLPLPPGEGRGEGASTLPRPLGEGRGEGALRRPAMLCLHQTTQGGKDSPVGLADRPTLHYARELAQRGYVTLAPDYPSLGEHEHNFDTDNYTSGSMKAIYDNTRAIDLLQSLPDVDGQQIGCIGHSLGGHNGLFTAVFDERIKVVVTSCGFTSAHKYYGGDLHGWAGPRYMPLVATKYNLSPDQMPFDFAEVLAAIAPRAIFVVAPLHDDNFEVSGVRDCLTAARPIYKLLGHPDDLQAVYPDSAHDFPDAERKQSYEFLDRILKARKSP